MLKLFLFALLPVGLVLAQERPKHFDTNYFELIPISDISDNCDSPPAHGYGIVNGGLEKCSRFLAETGDENKEDNDYEEYKCKNLRVNGHLVDGKCVCKGKWKGPLCNEFVGCPEGYTIRDKVCAPNSCHHDGIISVGSQKVECRCDAPWDGVWCERLACWRKAPKGHDRRWKNAGDHCECADGYDGDDCDIITKCKNGELKNNRCVCSEGYKGELCDRTCIPNQTCAAPEIVRGLFVILAPVIAILIFRFN